MPNQIQPGLTKLDQTCANSTEPNQIKATQPNLTKLNQIKQT